MEVQQSLAPGPKESRSLRRRLGLRGEIVLAALPTATVLLVLGLVEVLTEQRLLFASLASSAFLIYLDPEHGMNAVGTLVIAQLLAAVVGFSTFLLLGNGYLSGGTAIVLTIVGMIVLDRVHPPAVSTSLSFAFRANDASNLLLFALAVVITAVLAMCERFSLWLLRRVRG